MTISLLFFIGGKMKTCFLSLFISTLTIGPLYSQQSLQVSSVKGKTRVYKEQRGYKEISSQETVLKIGKKEYIVHCYPFTEGTFAEIIAPDEAYENDEHLRYSGLILKFEGTSCNNFRDFVDDVLLSHALTGTLGRIDNRLQGSLSASINDSFEIVKDGSEDGSPIITITSTATSVDE
jgi:hypothetical protein